MHLHINNATMTHVSTFSISALFSRKASWVPSEVKCLIVNFHKHLHNFCMTQSHVVKLPSHMFSTLHVRHADLKWFIEGNLNTGGQNVHHAGVICTVPEPNPSDPIHGKHLIKKTFFSCPSIFYLGISLFVTLCLHIINCHSITYQALA